MLNLTYHATRDEDVYNTISSRMKDRFDIFGGLSVFKWFETDGVIS